MKNQPKLLAILTAAALSAGCASGGGSGGSSDGNSPNGQVDSGGELVICIFLPFLCPFIASATPLAPSQAVSAGAPKVPFTTWSALPRGAETEAKSVTSVLSYQHGRAISATSLPETPFSDATERVVYPSAGQSAIEVRDGGILANPYVLGWEYQSFGVWNSQGSAEGSIRASSFGAPTPAAAVPASGSASFSGKLAGIYVSPAGQGAMAAADLSVNANFSTRSLNFSSTGTTTTRDARTPTAAPNLNLNGSFTYSAGSSSFNGTLTNSGGTMSGASRGQFYGPAAQELGGVFTVRSPTTVETFTGAYGAKR